MTAEELFNNYKNYTALTEGHYEYLVDEEGFKEALIEFAKYHVQEALKEASKKATMKVEYPDECYQGSNEYGQTYVCAHDVEHVGEYGGISIEEDSILNCYTLENIK